MGTVIAASPRNSAHPLLIEQSNGRSKFKAIDFLHKELNENKLSDKKAYIFYDPEEVNDILFLDSLIKPYLKDLKLLECRYAGHEVLFHLNKSRQLERIIANITEGVEPVVEDVETSYTYLGKAKHYLKRKKYEEAILYANMALEDTSIEERRRTSWRQVLKKAIDRKQLKLSS